MFPPPNKQIVVTNGKKAYEGTIAFAKNIDLSEAGYVKLSPPMCRVFSADQDSNFGLPLDLFSYASGKFKIITDDNAFNLVMSTLALTEDSGLTGFRDTSRVIQWVSGNWFMNAAAVNDYTGASDTGVYTSRIGSGLDFIELFVSRNTLVGVGTNKYELKQYDAAFSGSTDLTIPQNYAITGVAYSNNAMGIATRQGKNRGNAIFFVWSGSTASADEGWPVNDPYILDVAAYRSSWVLPTSGGQLLLFNGAGFDVLGTLPMFDASAQLISLGPTASTYFGKLLNVDGDKIYFNAPSLPEFAQNRKPYIPYAPAGVHCFDPDHGLYHMHAPSYSEYQEEECTAASNAITFAFNHFLETGDELWQSATSFGLTEERIYYAIKVNDTTIRVADTYEDALSNTALTLSSGPGSISFVKRTDYGIDIQRLQDCGVVKREKEYTGFFNSGATPFFLGTRIHPNDLSASRVTALNMTVPVMSNRGFFVLGKFHTGNLTDNYHAVAVKYVPLKPGSRIVVKAKTVDSDPIVVGDETLYDNAAYTGQSVLWDASGTVFETTTDLSGARDDDEVYVFAGPGAGQSSHIKSIEQSGSTWHVELDERIRAVSSNARGCVVIDRFKKVGEITHEDTSGMKRCVVGQPGPSMQVKVEMRGIGVKVSEVIPVSSGQQLAV